RRAPRRARFFVARGRAANPDPRSRRKAASRSRRGLFRDPPTGVPIGRLGVLAERAHRDTGGPRKTPLEHGKTLGWQGHPASAHLGWLPPPTRIRRVLAGPAQSTP